MERYPFVSFKTSFSERHNNTQRAILSAMRLLFDAERYAEVRQIQANVWAQMAHPKVGEVWYNDFTGLAVTVTEIMPPPLSNTVLDEQRGAVWVQNSDNTKTRYTFDEFADGYTKRPVKGLGFVAAAGKAKRLFSMSTGLDTTTGMSHVITQIKQTEALGKIESAFWESAFDFFESDDLSEIEQVLQEDQSYLFAEWRPDYEQFFSFAELEYSDETDARDFLDDIFLQMCFALLDVVKHEGI